MIYVFECGCKTSANIQKIKRGIPLIHGHKGAICKNHGSRLSHKIIKCKTCGSIINVDHRYKRELCEECVNKKFPWKAKQKVRNIALRIKAEKENRLCTSCNNKPIADGNRFLCKRCYEENVIDDEMVFLT